MNSVNLLLAALLAAGLTTAPGLPSAQQSSDQGASRAPSGSPPRGAGVARGLDGLPPNAVASPPEQSGAALAAMTMLAAGSTASTGTTGSTTSTSGTN